MIIIKILTTEFDLVAPPLTYNNNVSVVYDKIFILKKQNKTKQT